MRDTAQGYIKCMPLHIGDPVVRTDERTDGRSHDYYVTTKISWLDRLPNLLSKGARWCAGARAPLLIIFINYYYCYYYHYSCKVKR